MILLIKFIGFNPNIQSFNRDGIIVTAVNVIVIRGVILGNNVCETSCTRPPVIEAFDLITLKPTAEAKTNHQESIPSIFGIDTLYSIHEQ